MTGFIGPDRCRTFYLSEISFETAILSREGLTASAQASRWRHDDRASRNDSADMRAADVHVLRAALLHHAALPS